MTLAANAELLKAEKLRMAAASRAVRKRQKIGDDWNGTKESDTQAWPLAKALIAEKNTELLKYAMLYRRIYATANSEATLGGRGVTLGDGIQLDSHIHIKPNGEIAYKHVRQSTAADCDIPASRASRVTSDEQTSAHSPVSKAWEGDKPVNDMIDAQGKLRALQARLGHLCEPFEMACVDGATLLQVGNAAGIAARGAAMGAGRALVHMALITVRDCVRPPTRGDLAGW